MYIILNLSFRQSVVLHTHRATRVSKHLVLIQARSRPLSYFNGTSLSRRKSLYRVAEPILSCSSYIRYLFIPPTRGLGYVTKINYDH